MTLRQILQGAVVAAFVGMAGTASATLVTVDATDGPWNPAPPNNPYGVGDQTAAAFVPVNPGDTIIITWDGLSFTSSFAFVSPTVGPLGYDFLGFGSGQSDNCPPPPPPGGPPPAGQCNGIGSSGTFFPSHWIDPTNTGPQIALNALIGVFVDSAGVVLDEFATGNSISRVAPAGAVALQLGINDDIFGIVTDPLTGQQGPDNTGALVMDVTGSTFVAVPEPVTLALVGLGLAGLGFARRRKQ